MITCRIYLGIFITEAIFCYSIIVVIMIVIAVVIVVVIVIVLLFTLSTGVFCSVALTQVHYCVCDESDGH